MTVDPPGPPTRVAGLMLEMTRTRDAWRDSESIVNPAKMFVQSPSVPEDLATNTALNLYRAPYNRLPSFVERGRVNMNTAADEMSSGA